MTWFKIHDSEIDFTADLTYMTLLDAAKHTVEHVMASYPAPYYLMVSGGVDSQAMLYAWHLYGKDFIPVTVSYNNGLNNHDIETIYEFSKTLGIELRVKNFDLLFFYESEYDSVCNRYRCISPHFGAHYAMSRDLPGTTIFSGDPLAPGRAAVQSNNIWMLDIKQERSIIPFFFLETPEIAYSLLYESVAKRIKNEHEYFKVNFYKAAGIPVIPQEQKYTGFEKVKDYYDEHYSHLVTPETRRQFILKPSKRTYDILLRYPYEKKHGVTNYRYIMNREIKNV